MEFSKHFLKSLCLEITRLYAPIYISALQGKSLSESASLKLQRELTEKELVKILDSSDDLRDFVLREAFLITKYLEERKKKPQVRIKVEHPGILEVPKGKKVNELPFSHFQKLAKRKGVAAVVRALNNIKVWNKRKNPSLAAWAERMQNRVSSLSKERGK